MRRLGEYHERGSASSGQKPSHYCSLRWSRRLLFRIALAWAAEQSAGHAGRLGGTGGSLCDRRYVGGTALKRHVRGRSADCFHKALYSSCGCISLASDRGTAHAGLGEGSPDLREPADGFDLSPFGTTLRPGTAGGRRPRACDFGLVRDNFRNALDSLKRKQSLRRGAGLSEPPRCQHTSAVLSIDRARARCDLHIGRRAFKICGGDLLADSSGPGGETEANETVGEREENRFSQRVQRYARVGTNMGGVAARLGANLLLGSKDQQKNAAQLAAALGGLKGPLMKVAQLISTIPDAIPPEYAAELSQLQNQAPAMGWPFVRRRMAAELGPDWRSKFSSFGEEAAAAASLGQVHKAQNLDGRMLALKLQYPEMQSAVEADLNQLRMVMSLYKRMDSAIDTSEIVGEIGARLREELDYELEARHMSLYA